MFEDSLLNVMLCPLLFPTVIMSALQRHADTSGDSSQEAGARPALFIQHTLAAVCDRPLFDFGSLQSF